MESDRPAAIRMTRPLAMVLESMISAGTTGITRRCSTVPCSRSRISAAPVKITASIVILLTTCMTEENQYAQPFKRDGRLFSDREESRRTVHRPAPMPPRRERLLTTQDFARHRIGVAAEPRLRAVAFLPP